MTVSEASLTPELHVGHDDLLADGGEHAVALEDALVVGPLHHAGEELNGVTDQLQQRDSQKEGGVSSPRGMTVFVYFMELVRKHACNVSISRAAPVV